MQPKKQTNLRFIKNKLTRHHVTDPESIQDRELEIDVAEL